MIGLDYRRHDTGFWSHCMGEEGELVRERLEKKSQHGMKQAWR
jgi:hypothetical protein